MLLKKTIYELNQSYSEALSILNNSIKPYTNDESVVRQNDFFYGSVTNNNFVITKFHKYGEIIPPILYGELKVKNENCKIIIYSKILTVNKIIYLISFVLFLISIFNLIKYGFQKFPFLLIISISFILINTIIIYLIDFSQGPDKKKIYHYLSENLSLNK